MVKISFSETVLPKEGVLVVGVFQDNKFTPETLAVDKKMKGLLKKVLEEADFKGKKNQCLSLLAPQGLDASQLLVVGMGKPAEMTHLGCEELGARIAGALKQTRQKVVTIHIPTFGLKSVKDDEASAAVANGFNLKWWSFDKYKTKQKPEEKPVLKTLNVAALSPAKAKALYGIHQKVTESVFVTRTMTSEPPNVVTPDALAAEAKKLKELGVTVEVLGEKELLKLGCHAMLGVGQGSQFDSQLVVLQWNGGKKGDAPVAVVGKGVTFDSGGLSIKPAGGMEDMKMDMSGAAVVLGLIQALALRKAKVNVVGIMGLVENMPSGTAQRPGDVVKSMSGQTIEVLNTDAEGRLVLADALWYTQGRFKPKAMIDLATLTGAIIVCVGHEYAGLFSNNDSLCKGLTAAGQATGERLWRFPLGPEFDKDIDSTIADVKNIGSGRGAGSITAAQFLQRFVNDTPWAHLDIAGVAWDTKDHTLSRKGASGFGVRLLNQFISDTYEKN